jgi:hypothetical protein
MIEEIEHRTSNTLELVLAKDFGDALEILLLSIYR